jgi:hypothetical protein
MCLRDALLNRSKKNVRRTVVEQDGFRTLVPVISATGFEEMAKYSLGVYKVIFFSFFVCNSVIKSTCLSPFMSTLKFNILSVGVFLY